MTVMCCVCNKTKINDQWLPLSIEVEADEKISHSYCPTCLHAALTELETLGRLVGSAAALQPHQAVAPVSP